MRRYGLIILSFFILFSCTGQKEKVCVLQTNYGEMAFRFFEKDAPITSQHFQKLVNEGFYNGKDFYRVVKGHVIQTGGGGETIPAEFNKKPHIVGTVGLGRTGGPDSGNSEFYICLAPRPHLDGKYTVFGQLIEGLDVLEKIGNVEVDEKWVANGRIAVHKPKEPVVIEKAFIEMRSVE